ncbi:hydrogen peroxide-inducible genes activator [Limnobacter parvus]|uniref:Hydrogen peroxide-inducible genes activator n=1 Tax=Limnobacter parvus TaxID=2939690 RepID=A0ABT1XDM9_9BURK|nr:hydrogen peroxide-inducible genes activator [Limnobacter parvus]MCR2745386.1 hydrogen peroxide-inducible genes activator [Limnobacter parvus]
MKIAHTQATALSLKQLSYLLAVSETLNFTRAAEMCFVTQSTLSGGIAELERTLGVQLVERDRQRVALTPAGIEVVRRAQGILSAASDLVSRAQLAADPASGEFRLGIIPTIAPYVLGKILTDARAQFPQLQMSVRESQTRVLLEEVDSGELDAAVIALPVELGKLHARILFDEKLRLVAHQSDSLCKGPKQALEEIDTSRLLLLEKGHCLRDHTVSACSASRGKVGQGDAGLVEATNLSTMVQLVNSGIGCALLPDMAIQAGILHGTDVKLVSLAAPQPSRTIALVTRSSHPKLAFIENQLCELIKYSKPD